LGPPVQIAIGGAPLLVDALRGHRVRGVKPQKFLVGLNSQYYKRLSSRSTPYVRKEEFREWLDQQP